MWRLRRKGGSAVAEPPEPGYEFDGSDEQLLAEIDALSARNREQRSGETERELVRLRHLAALRAIDGTNGSKPRFAEPDTEHLPTAESLPEIAPAELTPELLRAGILRDGCLLVRGLVDRDWAIEFASKIDRSFAERERHDSGEKPADGCYDEFEPAREGANLSRPWIKEGGGVLAVDAPMLAFEMIDMFERTGITELVRGYLGEEPLISAHKTTLRKAEPSVPGAWHQDGAFMGPVRALNLWLSLSRCGDLSPGLDIVPRRFEEYVTTQTDEALLSYQISHSKAQEAAGDTPIIRPIFEPGDALFFDELCLHQTGSDPSMPNPRYAIESWFFGASAFPEDYSPLAV
jgi:Phytanoyl-CoA dioxygenase (PhyH)